MNKKNVMGAIMLTAVASLTMTSCNKSTPQMDEKSQTVQTAPGSMKIAYVEVDSLMNQYKFCKDYSMILQKKGQNIQATLAQKGQALQAAAANFQQKAQANAYTREQAQAIQANLQRQQQDLQALQQRLSSEFEAEQGKYNKALRDSLQHFLKVYNKDKKYSMILSKAGDNLLYADKALDITADVVNGLNKAYAPSAELSKAKEAK